MKRFKMKHLHLSTDTLFYLALISVTVILIAVFAVLNPRFMSPNNIFNVLRQSAPNLISAVAMTLVICTGGIDLSIGSLLAVVAVLSAMMASIISNAIVILLTMVLLGILIGSINGYFVAYQRIPPFIVTLATMAILRGIALVLTRGFSIPIEPGHPLYTLGRDWFLGVPVPVWITIGIILATWGAFSLTPWGIRLTGIGSNEEAVRRAGVNVKLAKLSVYMLSGAISALSGVILAARVGSGSSYIGQGFELSVITGVILGGTNLSGGDARLAGTVLGVLLLSLIGNGLIMVRVSAFFQQIAEGLILLGAIYINYRIQGRRNHA